MRRTTCSAILLAVGLIGVFPLSLAAQTFSVAAGPSFPMGSFSDEAVRGFHVQGSADLSLPVLPFGLRADVIYQDFGNVERSAGIDKSLGGEWFRQFGVMLNAKQGITAGAVHPYVLIGGGWLREWHEDRSYWGTSHWTFNLTAGAGIDVAISDELGFFVEARQLNLAGGEPLRMTPPAVSPEVAFRSIPISIGVRF